jgi:ABC-2 type transport system ATP-binding protein
MTMSAPVIRTVGLTRFYGPTLGVEDLDLEIFPGEVFGFLGPNGAGKTTAIRLLLDLIRPTKGRAFLFGSPSSTASIRSRVGYLPGELSLDGRMSGSQTLTFLSNLHEHPREGAFQKRQAEILERLGLGRKDLGRKVRDYSRGMKQKLALVAALQHQPELLILDEPTTGLDPFVREVVFQLMEEARERGATIFHSSHVLSEVDRTCQRVGVLRRGRLAALLSVEEARRAVLRRMVVEFRGEPPLAALAQARAEVTRVQGSRVEILVSRGLEDILRILAHHPVAFLSFSEPSLEEAFRTFYREEDPT